MENTPYGSSPSPTPGDGSDFFGGTVVPQTGHTREYADLTVPPSAAPASKRASTTPWLVLAVVGGIVLVAGFFGYRMIFGSAIEMPDTLMGMERIDPDSALGRELERAFSSAELDAVDFEFEVAGYSSGERTLVVAAADRGGNELEQEAFFTGITGGMQTQLPGVSLEEVDAGSAGGRMQCMVMPAAGAGACAWIGDDTLGVVVTTGTKDDIARTTIDVRDIIVQ
jgi:hypothetical protein